MPWGCTFWLHHAGKIKRLCGGNVKANSETAQELFHKFKWTVVVQVQLNEVLFHLSLRKYSLLGICVTIWSVNLSEWKLECKKTAMSTNTHCKLGTENEFRNCWHNNTWAQADNVVIFYNDSNVVQIVEYIGQVFQWNILKWKLL